MMRAIIACHHASRRSSPAIMPPVFNIHAIKEDQMTRPRMWMMNAAAAPACQPEHVSMMS
jgi:hypothetical protein